MELAWPDIMFKWFGLCLTVAWQSQLIQSIDNGEKGILKQIKQPRAKPDIRSRFDLNYDDDVAYSWNDVNVVIKKNRNAEQSKLPRKNRGAEISATDECSYADYYPYDYEQFQREYFDLNWNRRNNSRFEPGKPKKNLTYVCMPDDWREGVGLLTLYCILHKGFNEGFTQPMISRLAQIFKFWLVVYLVAGGSLWIICGWCCCCLKCKIFKPEETRQEVRRYILQNPPGVLRGKVTNECTIYKASREEIEVYNELEIKAYAYV